MEKLSLSMLKKYLSKIKSAREKHLTVEKFSRHVGIYPEVIAEHLSMFDPMINIDMEYNIRDLVPQIEEYIASEETKRKESAQPREVVRKQELKEFSSIQDFIYKKLTFGGVIDKTATLSDHDLKVLTKLIKDEQAKRAKKSKKSKK